MSPRQFGKTDASVGWPSCGSCPYTHAPGSPCPPPDTWLVLHFCPSCDERKQLYCRTHRDRRLPQPGVLPDVPAGADPWQRAAGDGGDR